MPNKKQKKKKDKKEEILTNTDRIVIFGLVFIIIFIIGFILSLQYFASVEDNTLPDSELKSFNNFVFENREGFWFTTVTLDNRTLYELMFYYHPADTLNVSTQKQMKYLFANVNLTYITLDPDLPSKAVIAGTEISKILGKVFRKRVIGAITRPANTDTSIITCENNTASSRVILLNITQDTRIYSDNNCIIIEGSSPNELIRAADRFAYELLGITEAGTIKIQ